MKRFLAGLLAMLLFFTPLGVIADERYRLTVIDTLTGDNLISRWGYDISTHDFTGYGHLFATDNAYTIGDAIKGAMGLYLSDAGIAPTTNGQITYNASNNRFEFYQNGAVSFIASATGDITSVGDVASGAAFDGTQGTTLTFYNAGGNKTLAFNGSQFDLGDDLDVAGNLAAGNNASINSNYAVAGNITGTSGTTAGIYGNSINIVGTGLGGWFVGSDADIRLTNRTLELGSPGYVLNFPSADAAGVLYSDGAGILALGDALVADGGSGRSSATAYAVICGGTTITGAHQSIAGLGTSGQVLTSNGAGALPTFQAASAPAGTMILLSCDNSGGSSAVSAALESYTLAANTYSSIYVEAEGYVIGAANSAYDWTFYIRNDTVQQDLNTVCAGAATGTGDVFKDGWSISANFTDTDGGSLDLYANEVTDSATAYVTKLAVWGVQ